jgi:hypothetical protein
MQHRILASIGILAGMTAMVVPSAGQAPAAAAAKNSSKVGAKTPAAKKPLPLRTPWGDPDLQGVWNDATSTPLQRPTGLAEKDVLNDDEAAEFRAQLAHDLTRDRRDGGAEVDVNRAYNDHWMDSRRLKITADHRTSLIVDPPNGRIPPLVPLSAEREQRKAERAAANTRFNAGLPENFTDFTLPVRCVIRTDSPPYLPTIYNNDFHVFQSPGYVVIGPEMIHSGRIIPLDGHPHLGKNLKQWLGDSRGHWEGDTLVVETTNFRGDDGVVFMDEDPKTWTRPWTARIPWNKIDPGEQMYEYACHEDNYDMVHFLTGARAREKRGETK